MKGANMIHNPLFGPLLAEGKTKQIYADPEHPDLAYMVSKDAITAGDGARRNELAGKSRWAPSRPPTSFVY
jgi:phosphoribosylaminoimidazole-succinocarboxamide synthase